MKIFIPDQMDFITDLTGFGKSYLRVTTAKEFKTGREYFDLRHKLTGEVLQENLGNRQNIRLLPSMIHLK